MTHPPPCRHLAPRGFSLALPMILGLFACAPKTSPSSATPRALSKAPPAAETTTLWNDAPAHSWDTRANDKKSPQKWMKKSVTTLSLAAENECEPQKWATFSGRQIAELVMDSGPNCANSFFSLKGSLAKSIFGADKMSEATAYFAERVDHHPGHDQGPLQAGALFLRAGWYVQYYNPVDVGDYPESLRESTRQALSRLFSSPGATDHSESNADFLAEAITLIDSSGNNREFVDILAQLYWAQVDDSWLASYGLKNLLHASHIVLFRGHYNPDFQEWAQNDSEKSSESLMKMINWLEGKTVGTDNEWLWSDSILEMTRFIQYRNGPASTKAQDLARRTLSTYPIYGRGDSGHGAAALQVNTYRPDECASYGVCHESEELLKRAMTFEATCSPSVRIRAQEPGFTPDQVAEICRTVGRTEELFHKKLETHKSPVGDDHNTTLELALFQSPDNYRKYAGRIYDISTDNGGIYLEGNPSDPHNQARFVAYRDPHLPGFVIWNLAHEFTHYLDGRYDLKGGFADSQQAHTVWWSEGLAEQMSHLGDYERAIEIGKTKSLSLPQLMNTDYNSGVDQVYRWGYLVSRFAFSRAAQDVQGLLSAFRAGDFARAEQNLQGFGLNHASEWGPWLDALKVRERPLVPERILKLGDSLSVGGDTFSQRLFQLDIPVSSQSVELRLEGGSGDGDLLAAPQNVTLHTFENRSENPGNTERLVWTPAGVPRTAEVLLHGFSAYQNARLTFRAVASSACEGLSQGELRPGCPLEFPAGQRGPIWFWMAVHSTNRQWRAVMNNTGTLYASSRDWPTPQAHQWKSRRVGSSSAVSAPWTGGEGYIHFSAWPTGNAPIRIEGQLTP